MLLCRPRGGFTDMVSQIERCCRYAERSSRTIIVDTKFGPDSYGDEFDRYFLSRQSRLILSARDLNSQFDSASTFPVCLQGRVSSYEPHYDDDRKEFVDRETQQPLTFNFARDYPHDPLVHQQHHRRPEAVSIFMRLRLQPLLKNELLARLGRIGGPYIGVHVRHTDYRSDYQPLIGRLAAMRAKRLFLATDNQRVLEEFKSSLPGKQIFSFAEDLSVDGKPIHQRSPEQGNIFRRNCDAILDLLLLAFSSRIDWAEITNSPYDSRKSGFTVLATNLFSQKRYLSELLGETVKIGLD